MSTRARRSSCDVHCTGYCYGACNTAVGQMKVQSCQSLRFTENIIIHLYMFLACNCKRCHAKHDCINIFFISSWDTCASHIKPKSGTTPRMLTVGHGLIGSPAKL